MANKKDLEEQTDLNITRILNKNPKHKRIEDEVDKILKEEMN